ncbi:acyl-CoA thioesterase [Marinomonas ostreistagni]|uniref:Acyl-CoA thioesterase n=1 Tax=Marinomonas ostreistagni TaxID=359209 RepID=A0ABS0Z9K2_9GAMM|nr:acyl-CoA thioesterase [Marinomonas ostreistagni]MBJ7550330.1 acyl-CoA thioesterase [Marinomonas ostreistagni]
MLEHEIELEIPFHDVDVMRIAWHGHYVKYLEIARCALLESIDYNCDEMEQTGYVWPVIELNIRYAKPLRFKQKIRVLAKVIEWENRLKIAYTLFDSESGQRLTKAYTVQVAVDAANGEMQFASPQILLDKLGVSA